MSQNQPVRLEAPQTNRFWEMERRGVAVRIRYGRLGAAGATRETEYRNESEAFFEARRQVRRLWCKGYRPASVEEGAVRAAAVFLASSPAYLEFGRWLADRNDPRGEQIVALVTAALRNHSVSEDEVFRRALNGVPAGVEEQRAFEEFRRVQHALASERLQYPSPFRRPDSRPTPHPILPTRRSGVGWAAWSRFVDVFRRPRKG